MPKDTTAANWARTLARLQRNAIELRAYGFEVQDLKDPKRPRKPDWSIAGGGQRKL